MPPTSRQPRSRQAELFPRSKRTSIEIAPNHRLAQITEELDWTELEELVQAIRLSKLKNAAGRVPVAEDPDAPEGAVSHGSVIGRLAEVAECDVRSVRTALGLIAQRLAALRAGRQ